MSLGLIIHTRDEDGPFSYINLDTMIYSQYSYCYLLGEKKPHYPVPCLMSTTEIYDVAVVIWSADDYACRENIVWHINE